MKKGPRFQRTLSLSKTIVKVQKTVSACGREIYPAVRSSKERLRATLMVGLLVVGMLAVLALSSAPTLAAQIAIGVSVRVGPPPLPVYAQPVCPGPGYMWTPGYWAYDPDNGYYWVPGTWVVPPTVGFLWTPGYWGWGGSAFMWHAGYWGPHVGFYGGINYGFGYIGVGFVGGEWRGREFFYNRAVNNLGGVHITNVYNRTVVNNYSVTRVSYNGGAGGITARPTRAEMAAEHERHVEATALQRQNQTVAHQDRAQFANANHGKPGVAATPKPGEFRGASAMNASRAGGTVRPAPNSGRPNTYAAGRGPNPGGGGNHQMMTAHSNPPASHNSGGMPGRSSQGGFHSTPPPSRNTGAGPAGRSSQGGFHPAPPPSHNQPASRGTGTSHQSQTHQAQPQSHRAPQPERSRPSGGEKNEEHEPHR